MLLKMLNKESNTPKGSDSDVFSAKRLNFPVNSNKQYFENPENSGNDFSKNRSILKKFFI